MTTSRRELLKGLGAGAALATARAPAWAQAPASGGRFKVFDVHGHFTTAPKGLRDFRAAQIAALTDPSKAPSKTLLNFSDDEVREGVKQQLQLQKERGIDVTLFSPTAGGMSHHIGNAQTSLDWSQACNDLIARVCSLYPESFLPVGQLPQSPGVSPANCAGEIDRLKRMGFVGVNVNPDPTGAYWRDPPLGDKFWYPLYEKLVEADFPAMLHVSASTNPNFQGTGGHYIAGDTTIFMQMLMSDMFKDFPALRVIIPHGGGAVPYHWGRYRGLAQDMRRPPLTELLKNVYFDTCVYHAPGLELLLKTIPIDNILFATEMVGAVRGIDPLTGRHYDDTKAMIDAMGFLSEADRRKLFQDNARRVYTLKI
jgi:4-oxalmesaconate hydratase